jgi:hypothetical protein
MPYIHVSTFDDKKNYGGLTCIVAPPFTVVEEIRNPVTEGYITAAIDVKRHDARRFREAPTAKGSDLFKIGEFGPFFSELPKQIIHELITWYQTLKNSTL